MAAEERNLDFWQGKRVLVTGHTGFIGSWLCHWLVKLGADVAGYALAPHTTPSLYDALGLDSKLKSTIGDICDRDALKRTIAAHQPEIVIHLAAQAIVGLAHAEPYETWRVNTLGTVALLEALRDYGKTKALCVFTTDKVYDNDEHGVAYTEEDAIGGYGLYDSSKGACELAVRAFARESDLTGSMTVRAGNVIGGGDWNEARLVPDCARAFAAGKPVDLRNPTSSRPWQHVLDVCYATLLLCQNLYASPEDYRGAWNIGPQSHTDASTANIADMLAMHWGQSPAWHAPANVSAFPEASKLSVDATKLRKALRWEPALALEEALEWTAKWYRAYQADTSQTSSITDVQIAQFTDRID